MPPRGRNTNTPPSSSYSGWYRDGLNGVLEWYHNGTKIGQASGATVTWSGAQSATTLGATTTVTAGTDLVSTAGHVLVPAGDVKLGTATTFASTQPVAAVVMGGTSKAGIAPVGAIATCGGLFASDTVCRKIIADGTASNVET